MAHPGHPERKVRWHNLRRAADVEVVRRGVVRPAVGHVLVSTDPEQAAAVAAYAARFPRVHVPPDAVLVEIRSA